jgi:hypothetical protein
MWSRVVVVLVVLAGTARATSYAPPAPRDETSANGAFVLHVDPERRTLVVRTAAGAPQWQLERDIGMEQFFVANDGKSIALVHWRFVMVEALDRPGVELMNATGTFAAFSVRELIAQPPRIRGVGPIGGFWREWLRSAKLAGNRVAIATTGLYDYSIDLTTAERTRSISTAGVLAWCLGLAMLALALVLAVWARRAKRGYELAVDRRRIVLAAIAPIGGCLWLWLDLAGAPVVPAEIVHPIRFTLWTIVLLIVPFAILATLKLPRGRRAVRLGMVIATAVALLGVRVLC